MNESITYRKAKISDQAADIICEMQYCSEYSTQYMAALSYAIEQSLMWDLPERFADVEYRDHLASLACLSRLVRALLLPPVKDEL